MRVIIQEEALRRCNGSPDKLRFIHGLPTIDAVPVVRCSECKHRGDSDRCPRRYLAYTTDERYFFVDYTQDDDFCSYGKKKDGDPDV